MNAARDYTERSMMGIPGWFSVSDATLFCLIAESQERASIHGDLLEIGVYEGKSTILLGYLLGPDESLVVCDLFGASAPSPANEREAEEWYAGLTAAKFRTNYLRFHSTLPVIHQSPSADLMARESDRRFRMIHVDGSHQYDDVCSDIAFARTTLVPDGILVLDDYRSAHTPGVAAAVWREIVLNNLIPLCVTPDKMYACWGDNGRDVVTGLRRDLQSAPGLRVMDDYVMGYPLLVVLPTDYTGTVGLRARAGRSFKKSISSAASVVRGRSRRAVSRYPGDLSDQPECHDE